jgi:putative ABC transport system permease protein
LAGLHLCFAFPIIRAILVSFELYNLGLFTVTTIASFVLFAIFYVVVYKSTSKAYYSIVSG